MSTASPLSSLADPRNAQYLPWTHPAETINPSLCNPRQHPRCSFTIAKSREHALAEATTCQMDSLCIFTDGSGYQDMVGAAATTLPQGGDLASEHRRHCLGPLHTHTVFEGKSWVLF